MSTSVQGVVEEIMESFIHGGLDLGGIDGGAQKVERLLASAVANLGERGKVVILDDFKNPKPSSTNEKVGRPFNSNLPDPSVSGHINHVYDRVERFQTDVHSINRSTRALINVAESIRQDFERVSDARVLYISGDAFSNIIRSKIILGKLISIMHPDFWDGELIKSLSDTCVLLDNILEDILKVERPTAPPYLDDKKPLLAAAEAKEVGAMFERAREGKGISKKAMARDHGIPTSNIRNFEIGANSPTLERIQKYADALGFDAHIQLVPKDKS